RSFFLCLFNASGAHRALHSFPTRRSSDLGQAMRGPALEKCFAFRDSRFRRQFNPGRPVDCPPTSRTEFAQRVVLGADALQVEKRSEEHTSELQSQSNLVCRLLLEKKKQKQ